MLDGFGPKSTSPSSLISSPDLALVAPHHLLPPPSSHLRLRRPTPSLHRRLLPGRDPPHQRLPPQLPAPTNKSAQFAATPGGNSCQSRDFFSSSWFRPLFCFRSPPHGRHPPFSFLTPPRSGPFIAASHRGFSRAAIADSPPEASIGSPGGQRIIDLGR